MSEYIERDALHKKYDAYANRTIGGRGSGKTIARFLDWIDEQPTADVVEVVHGEWMTDDEGEIYCSKCGKYTYDRHDEIKEFDGKTVIALCYPRFCGNCGADMRGKTDELHKRL